MELNLKYGSGEVSLELPPGAEELKHTEPEKSVKLDKFKRDLHSYLYSVNRRVKDVGIVVSDKTRLCQFPLFLPLIAEAFLEYGLKKEDITFYIAYGTHPRQTDQECLESYGELYREYRFVHHDSKNEQQLETVGTTSRGTVVKVNRAVLGHDLLVAFGAILHHYFAGFGGGRKLLFPGMAGYDSILQNHRLFLDFGNRRLHPGCQSGNLADNPLALDLEEIDGMLPPRLEIHGILNSEKEVCEIHYGLHYNHFRDACDRYDHYFRVREEKLYDMVAASAGGYPRDINFIQAHKSIHNAASFVRDGGTLVILAECRDGLGNQAFMEIFRLGGWQQIFDEVEKAYRNNAGTALAIIQKSQRISIRFVTSLDEAACRMMGTVKTSEKEAGELVAAAAGKVAWIENASLLYR
jgi:nickel-dependent lactate racemase